MANDSDKNENGKKEKKDGKDESSKSDLITIVSSEEKEIPEKRPPFESILYDFIPEVQKKFAASRDDQGDLHPATLLSIPVQVLEELARDQVRLEGLELGEHLFAYQRIPVDQLFGHLAAVVAVLAVLPVALALDKKV